MVEKLFYDSIRKSLFRGSISSGQFSGIASLLKEYAVRKMNSLEKLAYILATIFHETGKAMLPVEEYGRGKGYDYGKMLKMGGGRGKRIPYTHPKQIYYGRGGVQLTWFENYDRMGKWIGVDLLNYPEKALELDVSTKIAFEGMIRGMFTGVSLDTYFKSGKKPDPVGARKIINGTDKDELIAGYYYKFLEALEAK